MLVSSIDNCRFYSLLILEVILLITLRFFRLNALMDCVLFLHLFNILISTFQMEIRLVNEGTISNYFIVSGLCKAMMSNLNVQRVKQISFMNLNINIDRTQ